MRLQITHRTAYIYSRRVYLEPHTLRFRPRSDGSQDLLRFELEIEPRPTVQSECLDAEGNIAVEASFKEMVDRLEVRASAQVETRRVNPFDYVLTGDPFRPGNPALDPYRDASRVAPAVRAFAEEVSRDVDDNLLRFLPELSRRIYEDFKYEVRLDGEAEPAAATLESRRGACRDLAVLFIDACRARSLPARFVSGYQFGDAEWERHDLHAWAEVYLPGGGWRGYDPSHGIAADQGLVAVAAALDPRMAAPVTGTFRGTDATQMMEFDIRIVPSPES